MKKSIEVKAQSVDLAIEDGLSQLNTTKDRVDVEVLSEGGLFSKAQVRLTLKPTAAEVVEDFCNNLLEKMHIKAQAIVTEEDSVIKIDIMGDEASHAIGYRGETLDSIQYLALTVLNQGHQFKKVVVNTGCYREKREQTLISLANRLADKAYRTGKKVVLEPMNPFERRIIHTAIQDSAKATTASEGEEPLRHVVIIPKSGGTPKNNDVAKKKRTGMPKFKSFGYKRGF